jgi:hypothetical protein
MQGKPFYTKRCKQSNKVDFKISKFKPITHSQSNASKFQPYLQQE